MDSEAVDQQFLIPPYIVEPGGQWIPYMHQLRGSPNTVPVDNWRISKYCPDAHG
jgi:hypothetical protein